MKMLKHNLMTAALLAMTSSVFAANVPPDHPILGTWQYISLNHDNCVETYEFRTDGINHGISRDEISDSRYDVSATSDAQGFYRYSETLITINGKKSCEGGPSTPVGEVLNAYIHFDPSQESMVLCQDHSFRACMSLTRSSSPRNGQP